MVAGAHGMPLQRPTAALSSQLQRIAGRRSYCRMNINSNGCGICCRARISLLP
jgi:hypothetical protein